MPTSHSAASKATIAVFPRSALVSEALSPKVAASPASLGVTRLVPAEGRVFDEGDKVSHHYKVVSGAVRVFKLTRDGRRQISAFHLPGDFFSFEPGETHRFSAEALADTILIAYKRRGPDLLSAEPELAGQLVAAMVRTLESAREHMLLLGRKCATEKIATFLLEMSERAGADQVELPMNRTDIGDYLGLTIETVSRTLTQMERDGIITLPRTRKTIVLCNKHTLQDLNV